MNIAFVSFEYPPETGGGGIGTYLKQVHSLLKAEGHDSTIICATRKETPYWEEKDIYRIPASDWADFDQKLPEYFRKMEWNKKFDVIEGTDFGACGLSLKTEFPDLPLVIRLHTPLFLVDQLLFQPLQGKDKMRFILGSLRRFKLPTLPKPPLRGNYSNEFSVVKLADRISSPGISISSKMTELGFEINNKTDIVPLPVSPPREVFAINARASLKGAPHIIYIGRLEKRKGVIDLAEAIPEILNKYPSALFTFIGRASASPNRSMDMADYLRTKLGKHVNSVTFTGAIPYSEVLGFLNSGDIFVFPSHYESFGIACCEAMAAGKAVIGSSAGGMAEIISEGCGLLVPPHSPLKIADQVLTVINDDKLRIGLGINARERILRDYSAEAIIPLQLQSYEKAIEQVKRNTKNRRTN